VRSGDGATCFMLMSTYVEI